MSNFDRLYDFLDDQPQGTNGIRVLVVDDNATLARLFTLLLKRVGFAVQTLFDGLTVLETVRSFRPHFILLDIGLPGINGYEVAEQIRSDSEFDSLVIIAVSAYSPDQYPEKNGQAGFDYRLTKPVSLGDLLPIFVPG